MKQALSTPLLGSLVAVAFAAVAALVWLTHGRAARLIRAKLVLGALLLALGFGGTACDRDDDVVCYSPPTTEPTPSANATPAPPEATSDADPRLPADRDE